ncbi:uncharacterized protein PGTG_18026 [Puccinia graminis f. sp. tritici CRL 75-36-700-3]|uniref:DUF6589 domain-containing protein n=1 Tax=Puccinia graminis f. sp. tritici (strain CRL 75-36-700-3 / race SCCL) TaxID=418459 RepID=E3L5K7_PUCGT|nr:uncharacterized protein PGTG_18026 [Puccinia graminis f. sp. tritici CRL 75-36-700-3]EFP91832.2 hypothetical protein PGTG_18026 [Puccinia graminis f. sp. tritici CRL 75-36-700-3]
MSLPAAAEPKSSLSDEQKILEVCEHLTKLKMTPKEFITGLLRKNHPELNYRRRTWGTTYGSKSTIDLASEISKIFQKKDADIAQWTNFIQEEVIRLCRQEFSIRRTGSFQSSQSVSHKFFSQAAKDARMDKLSTVETPLLFNIVLGIISQENNNNKAEAEKTPVEGLIDLSQTKDPLEDGLVEYGGFVYTPDVGPTAKDVKHRHIASVICSMLKFTRNRRDNGLQLENSIRFYACGVSETVNEYLHYLGLTSHRKTAIEALLTLSREAMDRVANSMALSNRLAPLLCIDNLDLEERVQMATVGKQDRTFHGTWGYLHIPSNNLMNTISPAELTLEAYNDALRNVVSFQIDPQAFIQADLPNHDYALVWKSQIARVMLKYVATPADRRGMLPLDPPVIEQISNEAPEILMLQLMEESDNSAEGIGQVMDALSRQSRLEPEEFFGRLQLMDGDLGTCQLFHAIRMLRLPSSHCDHNLNNTSMALGASHTLWNIAHTILTYHFGKSNAMDDLGVWRYLEALGIPPDKVIQKKDFTKMLECMEKVHEATIWFCLREVMGKHEDTVEEILPVMPTQEWNKVIEQCYLRYCTNNARHDAKSSPQRYNLLLRMRDFSTVIEANRSMKAGDIGRLINVWKMWSLMTQSLPGLTHYSAYLPRLVLLITEFLPPDLAKLVRHTLLVSPRGRVNHFVSKDFLLETANYWLKFFYTRAGVGTQVERLKKLISSNIPLLRSMFDSLRTDSGSKHIQQSHQVVLTMRALERFQQMAASRDILGTANPDELAPSTILRTDTYLDGINMMKAELKAKPNELARFKMHLPFDEQAPSPDATSEDNSDVMMEE